VHLHSRRGADVLGGIAARIAGCPAVLSRRVDNTEPRWFAALKYRLYAAVVGISGAICAVLRSQGVAEDRLSCIPSAVDTARYARDCDPVYFERCTGLEPASRTIAMVAQFIPRKGHTVLFKAVPNVIARHPEVRFLLFGRGPLEEALRAETLRLGLGEVIRFPGFVHDLERLLPCCYALVHPANLEGLGVSLLEAGAAGLPIVAARAGGIPEIVEDGRNGLLVPPDDPDALALALIRLLDEPALHAKLASNAHRVVLECFSTERMVEDNHALYRRLTEKA